MVVWVSRRFCLRGRGDGGGTVAATINDLVCKGSVYECTVMASADTLSSDSVDDRSGGPENVLS